MMASPSIFLTQIFPRSAYRVPSPTTKLVVVFTVILVALSLVVSISGVLSFGNDESQTITTARGEMLEVQDAGVYRYSPRAFVTAGIPWDFVRLLGGIPILLASFVFFLQGSLRGTAVFIGSLASFLYQYLLWTFGWAFNRLFLVYVASFSLSLCTLTLVLVQVDLGKVRVGITARFPVITTACFSFAVGGVMFGSCSRMSERCGVFRLKTCKIAYPVWLLHRLLTRCSYENHRRSGQIQTTHETWKLRQARSFRDAMSTHGSGRVFVMNWLLRWGHDHGTQRNFRSSATASARSSLRKVGRILVVILIVTIAIIMVTAGLLLFWSPGKVRPILDVDGISVPNSISEKIYVNINGVKQGMFLRSSDVSHPVLLYLHGGPAMPTYFLEQRYPTGLERDFTIAWWEQRGAGLSFISEIPSETITVQQLVEDTVAVADYLRGRFGKNKIYLMGHSWGSFIGIQAAAQSPERFFAYIGVAQITNQRLSERLAYEYMLSEFRAQGNVNMVRKLEESSFEMTVPLPTVPLPESYMAIRDEAMHTLGVGTMREMSSVITGVFWPVWQNREYTLSEKINIWRGKWSASASRLRNQMLTTDITVEVPRLEVPVYFLHGKYDYTASYVLAKAYLQQLQAPLKGFYTYENSAHSPIFEDPERTRFILTKDVLGAAVSLSDDVQSTVESLLKGDHDGIDNQSSFR
jgi:pimeloyl-ACP methyl ester carboxylesterase